MKKRLKKSKNYNKKILVIVSIVAIFLIAGILSLNSFSKKMTGNAIWDLDNDGINNTLDNCPNNYNPNQEDTYPPGGNGIGDACECEGNFDGDYDQDGLDASTFKKSYGRNRLNRPCTDIDPCNGDFDCEGDVDGQDASKFKTDFGRSSLNNPCPNVTTKPWCKYPCEIKSLNYLIGGAYPKWSPDGKTIAFNKKGESDCYMGKCNEIWTLTFNEDGTRNLSCLTCSRTELPINGNRGQPYWHPNGEYIIFTAQNTNYPRVEGVGNLVDVGLDHNVWIMKLDSAKTRATNFWQITNNPRWWGVIKPTFSHDGSKIFWNEEFSCERDRCEYTLDNPQNNMVINCTNNNEYVCTYPVNQSIYLTYCPLNDNDMNFTKSGFGCCNLWGEKNMVCRKGEELATFRIKYGYINFSSGQPQIDSITTLNPPIGLTIMEISGFTHNDNGFIFSADVLNETNGKEFFGELFI